MLCVVDQCGAPAPIRHHGYCKEHDASLCVDLYEAAKAAAAAYKLWWENSSVDADTPMEALIEVLTKMEGN